MKLSKLEKQDWIYLGFILLASILTVVDLFINKGRSANGDGIVHMVTPALFAKALSQGNFPVGWTDGFANYGLPLGTISQQLTTYLIAFFVLISHNPVFSFNVVAFIGVLFSNIFLYWFLRIYFFPVYSFAGVFLFNFSPYRILNLYIRGDMPEFFAGVFMPLLLISSYYFIRRKNLYGILLFILLVSLLALTHPFMLIVSMFLLIPYVLFLLITNHDTLKIPPIKSFLKIGTIFLIAICFGLAITSYYILPLISEIKYFYYGQAKNHLTPNNFLTLQSYFFYNWSYFKGPEFFGRGFIVYVGILESLLFLIAALHVIVKIFKRNIFKSITIIEFAFISGLILIFMTTPPANFVYQHISFLANIQFPWRMLFGFVFLPPILLAFYLQKFQKLSIVMVVIFLICVLSFPQLYGKNYTEYPLEDYLFTQYNLHAVVMNTIWTGRAEDYPIEKQKWSIIEGNGVVTSEDVKNSSRQYIVNAVTPIRMVDYTFYFPGWNVYIDHKKTPIEYQNPNYRGVITYLVPAGNHIVQVKYEDTKIRLFGKIITMVSLGILFIFFVGRKKSQILFNKFYF